MAYIQNTKSMKPEGIQSLHLCRNHEEFEELSEHSNEVAKGKHAGVK